MYRVVLVLAFLTVPSIAAVYQSFDAKGNVKFSDVPSTHSTQFSLISNQSQQVEEDDNEWSQTQDVLQKIQLLMTEIQVLQDKLDHFALNDYEEAILKIRLSKMRGRLEKLQQQSHHFLSRVEHSISDEATQSLSVKAMNIRQIEKAIEIYQHNPQVKQFFFNRLKQEKASLSTEQLKQ